RLVTAAYHLPRARLELARHLPEVEIFLEPASIEPWRSDAWWSNRRAIGTLIQEYVKYLAAWLRSLPDALLQHFPSSTRQEDDAARCPCFARFFSIFTVCLFLRSSLSSICPSWCCLRATSGQRRGSGCASSSAACG